MHKKHLAMSVLLTAMLASSAASFAQDRHHDDNDRRDDNRYSQRDQGDDRRGGDYRGDDRRGDDNRGDDRRWQGRDNHRFDDNQRHAWRRGERLPQQYRNRQYVVDDWRGHGLRQPKRGYHWVQTGNDYVLAAIATGVIADILVNH